MKKVKQQFLFGIIALLCFNSCYKDGDFDALKNPIGIEINPTLGAPLINTSITIQKMLGLFNETSGFVKIGPNNEVIVVYSDSIQKVIHTQKKTNVGTKSLIVTDVIEGDLPIDFFKNMQGDSLSFSLQSVMLSLACHSLTPLENAPVSFKNIHLKMQLPNGQFKTITTISTIDLQNISDKKTFIIDNLNIADLVNYKPDKFFYTATIEIDLSRMLSYQIPDEIDLNLYFDFEMMLSGATKEIELMDTIDFSIDIDLNEITIERSKFILMLNNGLPLKFDIELTFVDQDYRALCSFFDPPVYTIQSALVDNNGFAISSIQNKVESPLSSEKITLYNKAKYIIMRTTFETAENGNKTVTIQDKDALKLRLNAILNSRYTMDLN